MQPTATEILEYGPIVLIDVRHETAAFRPTSVPIAWHDEVGR